MENACLFLWSCNTFIRLHFVDVISITNAFIPIATYSTCSDTFTTFAFKIELKRRVSLIKSDISLILLLCLSGCACARGAFNCIIIIHVKSRTWQTFAFCKIFLNTFLHNTRQSNCCTRPRIKEWKMLCKVAIVDLGDFWHWRHCKQWTAHLLFKMMWSTIGDRWSLADEDWIATELSMLFSSH